MQIQAQSYSKLLLDSGKILNLIKVFHKNLEEKQNVVFTQTDVTPCYLFVWRLN